MTYISRCTISNSVRSDGRVDVNYRPSITIIIVVIVVFSRRERAFIIRVSLNSDKRKNCLSYRSDRYTEGKRRATYVAAFI